MDETTPEPLPTDQAASSLGCGLGIGVFAVDRSRVAVTPETRIEPNVTVLLVTLRGGA